MSQEIWEGHHGEDPSLTEITDEILQRLERSDIKERVDNGRGRDDQLKQLKWGIRQQDEEKLMRAIEDIIRRVLVEERIATKITIFK